MPTVSTVSRWAGRAAGSAVIARTVKRYPIISVTLFVWRWWRRRSQRSERSTVRLRDGETLTISQKRS